jgi:hypothetical protein
MQIAKHSLPSVPAHRASEDESEVSVWIMVVVLLGLTAFAIFTLLHKVGM